METQGILLCIGENNFDFYIDLSQINMKYLEGARVFKILFKLTEITPFKNEEIQKNLKGRITIFKDLGISRNDWFKLFSFLKNGRIAGKLTSENNFYYDVDKAMEVSNKLGGFPMFDMYYRELTLHKISELTEEYNPLLPSEDYRELYKWSGYLRDDAISYARWKEKYQFSHNMSLVYKQPTEDGPFYWHREKIN